ncbi:cation transporter [Marinobacter sp. X15-166B]|uniref:cation transporter n=1 Tax=Marinobacter sp. X15-166B TaxID=1897620 RepID=UPI00085C469C|nr:cation transporter [Marinobacter sp. X15-166B]OEY66607.1 hypothetical protein BG841_09170 [Marinobacter sp. X15-166B]
MNKQTSHALERKLLVFSSISAAIFAVAGIAWGLWIGSLVIIFDGGYSLLSLALSMLSLLAWHLIRQPADERYNFGRMVVEPLAIVVKGVVIMGVCVISLVAAILALFQGGRVVDADLALGFSIVNILGCAFTWICLVRNASGQEGLVAAESRQWFMDLIISVAVMAGFVVAKLVQLTPWAHLAVYADPLMVIVASTYFLAVPARMTLTALHEVLLGAPPAGLRAQVERALADENLDDRNVRLAKVGSYLIVDVDAEVGQVVELGETRQRLTEALADVPLALMLNVHFHPSDTRGDPCFSPVTFG